MRVHSSVPSSAEYTLVLDRQESDVETYIRWCPSNDIILSYMPYWPFVLVLLSPHPAPWGATTRNGWRGSAFELGSGAIEPQRVRGGRSGERAGRAAKTRPARRTWTAGRNSAGGDVGDTVSMLHCIRIACRGKTYMHVTVVTVTDTRIQSSRISVID